MKRGMIMGAEKAILDDLKSLPSREQAEVLDFIEYLKIRAQKKERMDWSTLSLDSAMRGMEDEPGLYSMDDVKERFK
jgi:hypothetical protein